MKETKKLVAAISSLIINRMNNAEYIQELGARLRQEEYDDDYIDACIHYATNLLDHGFPVVFDIEHLALLLGLSQSFLLAYVFSNPEKLYMIKQIPKKSGGTRTLSIPCFTLKYIQRWIYINILQKMPISQYSMGFAPHRSILTNAQAHIGSALVLNFDIKDFFPSISLERVYQIFRYYGYTKELSFTFSKLCTYNSYLPQGSPASPCLSNIVCLKLDKRLAALASSFEARYTRYADDLTFSGGEGIVNLAPIVIDILNDEGFQLNTEKTRINHMCQRQEVTGLIVNNGRVSIPRSYKRTFEQEIYFCRKFGVTEHQRRIKDTHRYYKEHLYGKACFIYMVEPKLGARYLHELDQVSWEG